VKFVCLRYFNAPAQTEKFGEDNRPETHLNSDCVAGGARRKDRTSKFMATDYDSRMGPVIRDYQFTILDLCQRAYSGSPAKPLAVLQPRHGRGSSVREVIEIVPQNHCEKSRRSKNPQTGDPPGSSLPRRRIRKKLVEAAIPIPRRDCRQALGNGIRSFLAATKVKAAAVLL